MEFADRTVHVGLSLTSGGCEPLRVVISDERCHVRTGNNMETRSLQHVAENDKYVKVVFRDERLTFVAEDPRRFGQLIGLALDGYGTTRFGVGGKDIDASRVAEGDGCNEATSREFCRDEILARNAGE